MCLYLYLIYQSVSLSISSVLCEHSIGTVSPPPTTTTVITVTMLQCIRTCTYIYIVSLSHYQFLQFHVMLDIDIHHLYSSVLCESSSGDNNNNNNNNNNSNAPATDSTIGIIIGVVVAVVVVIVVLVVVTAVVVGVKVKRNRSTHHDSTPHGPSNTDVPITCKYLDTSHHIQYNATSVV